MVVRVTRHPQRGHARIMETCAGLGSSLSPEQAIWQAGKVLSDISAAHLAVPPSWCGVYRLTHRQRSLQVNMLHPDTLKILWKGYMNQLALSLLELDGINRAAARERAAQLSQEASELLLRFAAANPHGFKTLSASHLEDPRSEPPAWSGAERQAPQGTILSAACHHMVPTNSWAAAPVHCQPKIASSMRIPLCNRSHQVEGSHQDNGPHTLLSGCPCFEPGAQAACQLLSQQGAYQTKQLTMKICSVISHSCTDLLQVCRCR